MTRTTARAFRNYRDPAAQRYLHLVDGGVIDNFGVLSLMVMQAAGPAPSPLTGVEAVSAKRVLMLVVNAERVRPREWQRAAAGPGGGEALYSALDVATDAAKRSAYDAFRASAPEFERDLRQFRCDAARELHGAQRSNWTCNDVSVTVDMISFADLDAETYERLISTPTQVTLGAETIDMLIAAGRNAVERNENVRQLRR